MDDRSPQGNHEIEIYQFGCRVFVMVSYRRPHSPYFDASCAVQYQSNRFISNMFIASHMLAHMSAGSKNSPLFKIQDCSLLFPNNIKKAVSCWEMSSLISCLLPFLLFSITFSSCLAFIYVSFFFSIIFLKRKINTLPFSAVRTELRK